ncbi:MAG: tetratricopeptide repeat protein [Byssovorax sp.]
MPIVPLPAPYALRCPRCEEEVPTALADRAAWMRIQLWKVLFLVISVSVFRQYGTKKLGSVLLGVVLGGGLFGFVAATVLGWLLQIGIDFFYFGVLGNEDKEALAPGAGTPIVKAIPREQRAGAPFAPGAPKPGGSARPPAGGPAALHQQAVQADHQGDKARAFLLYKRFFDAPAGDLAALRIPLSDAQKRFEVLSAEVATWSAETWVNAASRFAGEQLLDEATACTDRALALDATHAGAWSCKAFAAFKRGERAIASKNYGGGALGEPDPHFEEAVRCFDESLKSAPDKIGNWESRGMALFFLQRPDESRKSFARARALKPKTERYLTVREDGNAIVMCDPGAGDDAPGPADRATDAEALEKEGIAQARAGRLDDAIATLKRAVEADPARVSAMRELGVGLAMRGDYPGAIAIFDRALAVAPDDALALDHKGVTLARMGKGEEAVAVLDKALAIEPSNAGLWKHKGAALASLARPREALVCYDKARAIDPKLAEIDVLRAMELEKLGRVDDAVETLERVAQEGQAPARIKDEAKHELSALRTRRARSHALPASLDLEIEALDLGRKGRLEDALAVLDQAVKADPRNAGAWSNRANALSELGRHEDALHSAETALKIAPRSADTWGNKGRALAELGRHSEALACFDKALSFDPKHAMSWYNRGVSMWKDDDMMEAVHSFEKALEIDPNHVQAQRAYELLIKEMTDFAP